MAFTLRHLIMVGVAVVGLLTAASAAGAFGTAAPAEVDLAQTDTTDFDVGNMYDSSQVMAGENVTVQMTLSNTNAEAVTQPVTVRLDPEGDGSFDVVVAETEITLDAGQSETVSLKVPTEQIEPGTYTYGVFLGDSPESPSRTAELVVER